VVSDGYSGYNVLNGAIRAGCWAHARRKWVEAMPKGVGIQQLPLFLSGGNQQKVVLGKWLSTQSRILIFDEPTRGIDIGARNEIYHLIDNLARNGVSILLISSDLPEIMTIADRVYIMREGRIVKELDVTDTTQETIAGYAIGGVHENE
jgi:ABC-type sugar transport system ATPase subunit